jgi:hypothetical protein
MNSRIHPLQKWLFGAAVATAALCLLGSAAWSETSATVNVNAASVSATVPSEGYGLNTYTFDGQMLDNGVASEVKASGVTALRYPGGSYSDLYTYISATDFVMDYSNIYYIPNDTFANFMSELDLPSGSKPVITLNYGSNSSATGPAPVSEAVTWLQYANVTNNYGIVYWEIGNETYGNGYYSGWDWENDLHDLDQTAGDRVGNSALSPYAYGTNAAAFVKALKAVDPNIKACISVRPDANGWDQGVFQGISNALNGSGYSPDCIIEHWYPSGSAAQNLAVQAQIPATVAQFRSELNSYYTLGNKNNIQIIVTETGPSSSVDPGVGSFLFALDDYLTWLENGAQNIDYQDLHQGFLSSTSSDATTPLGPWYGASLSSTLVRVGDNLVAATSSNSLLRAHAAQRTDGQTAVVLINDDPNNSTSVSVSVSGATLSTSGTQYNFGNANFSNGSGTANSGIGTSSIGGLGSNFTVTVPAYSAMGIVIPSTGTGGGGGTCTATAITPYISVSGAWTEETSATVTSTTTVVDLGPQPETGGTWAWTGPNGFTSTAREIDGIALSAGANAYTATYTNSCGAKSTQTFTITAPGGSTGTGTAITPYLQVNAAAWQETNVATVAAGSTVNLGPQPVGGTWAWTGPNGFTSNAREIDGIPLTAASETFVATYTNASGAKSTETFTITVTGLSGGGTGTGNLIANGTYVITSVHSGLALGDPNSSTANSAVMEQLAVTSGTNEQWTVNNLGNNVITLTNKASGQMLDVNGASVANGALVDQWPANGQNNQKWTVISLGGGHYELTSVNSGLALDVDGGVTTAGAEIDQYTYNGNSWQQWIFTAK